MLYGDQSRLNPSSAPNTSITLNQPLLTGRGREVNLRYIRIARTNQRISRLLFYQQLISTIYGISRLYCDLVSLNENAQVKRETLAAAQKLLKDNRAQVELGTLAPLEATRAQSLVTSRQLDLIQAEGLVKQQEIILKTQLARQGASDPVLADLHIVPTDPIRVPPREDLPARDVLVSQAPSMRPDLAQATLQVESSEMVLKGSQNETHPEIDLVANFQTRGSSELPYGSLETPGTGQINVPPNLSAAAFDYRGSIRPASSSICRLLCRR